MAGKLFGITNPNEHIFIIQGQKGSDILEGDVSVASIGDATLQHVQEMSGYQRMAYDEFICMSDGNLFRVLENRRWDDPDEFNLKNKSEMEMFLKKNNVPESLHHLYDAAVEQELERQDSEDVMDRQDHIVPFDQWEKFPQQWERWDVPATPRPITQFVGNARQAFYDHLPENHPLYHVLTRVINTLDQFNWQQIMRSREIIEHNRENKENPITQNDNGALYIYSDRNQDYLHVETYLESVRKLIFAQSVPYKYKKFVYEALHDCIVGIADCVSNPVDLMITALERVEDFWTKDYVSAARKRTKLEDPLYTYLAVVHRKAVADAKAGKDPMQEIRQMGRQLFKNGFVCTRYVPHWSDRLTGEEFENKVLDESQSYVSEIPNLVHSKEVTVQRMKGHHWSKYRKIKEDIIAIRARRIRGKMGEMAGRCITRMNTLAQEALSTRNLQHFTKVAQILIQKQDQLNMSPTEWDIVWGHYNDLKGQVVKKLTRNTKVVGYEPQLDHGLDDNGYEYVGISHRPIHQEQ